MGARILQSCVHMLLPESNASIAVRFASYLVQVLAMIAMMVLLGPGGGRRGTMKTHAVLLTRCPIHARRFHRFCLRGQGDGGVAIEALNAKTCCRHQRSRKLRLFRRGPL